MLLLSVVSRLKGGGLSDPVSAVVAFLVREGVRAGEGAPDTVHTHISVIVRFNQVVYKVKRPVSFPYLDFSTPQKRYEACLKELALNRRTAPELYLGVRRITRGADGTLEFDGPGELVEAALQMRRFDDDGLLATMAQRGQLDANLMTRVAAAVAESHRQAPVWSGASGADRLRAVLALNQRSEAGSVEVLGSDLPQRLNRALAAELEHCSGLLDVRAANGRVRHCHGDLHLGNLCVYHDEPVLFDCLEFNDEMATIDVLYDLSFVLMDLWRFGQPALANWVMNRYLDLADEADGLPVMPFFMALRAAIRAQILATQAGQARGAGDDVRALACVGQAMTYLDLAFAFLKRRPPALLAIGGLSGSGKSTVAAAVAYAFGPVPGARVLSSDRLRKRLFSVVATTRLPPEAYASGVSEQVYAEQRRQSLQLLGSGVAVVADAVFSRPDEREKLAQCAATTAVPFVGVWLDVPPERLFERVAARQNDPSDATGDVVRRQLHADVGAMTWHRVLAEGSVDDVAQAVLGQAAACLPDQCY
ncbi:AAA family ATPase [Neopusillimonas aromaticivorans]|uniref:bifunctional aminoglycoside phosphotransferase/ATP-binding protein n=1 Tax=Neopusillimonas aromaticivorans TaxID=2979868 RepID=UPI0025960608|nr:bifunctional aminoglycoside phosphotransferase/ATP-binding protein [Neopusillimonas aromaticivorans]WJJ94328.1 AAA family ATPase [Neopusillimonas aromaticivorans]